MSDFTHHFSDFDSHLWFNAASEGPMPLLSVQKLNEAVKWKSNPHLLDIPKFIKIPLDLKKAIGQLLDVDHKDVILGNSASYGLHILANGLCFEEGDQVLLMQNDFPTNILPWLALEQKQVDVVQISAKNHLLTPKEVLDNITSSTRVVCLSHVHTFSGKILDVVAISKMCKERGIVFILNVS